MCAPAQAFPHFSFLLVCLSSPSPLSPPHLLEMRAPYRIPHRSQTCPSFKLPPYPPVFIRLLRLCAEELVRIKTGTVTKGALSLFYQKSRGNPETPGVDDGRHVWASMGAPRWAVSSGGFLAKLLLAWVPLGRSLEDQSFFHCLITELKSPFKHVCSGRERATSDRPECAACFPTENTGKPMGQGSLVLLVAHPGVNSLIHSFTQPVSHSLKNVS